ncbi:Trk system potassium transporter TrkA [candidate division KSB3 bacterium]|uniref:Trk system potassium uptake protein TrkA n=1 Tax=candidate division KSB3 bacterium TaxID=2044937 RepID=A0A2G6E237_9BACT|nr:MAG: Trk system potassium transporter TrkA [candidate division KSB3 bacterium]PIE28695.1 MAG: Trk system potassium transporter TrkA [candidate division KSB3 bacterium]
MHIVIVGLGEVGSYLASMLASHEKYDVVGIDNSPKRIGVLEEAYDVQTIEGHGSAPHILREAEVNRADIFLAVSNNDEVNIVSALIAQKLGAAFTVARVSNPLYLEEEQLSDYEALGINLLISPERRTALTLFQSIEYPQFLKVDTLGDGRVHINQYRISSRSPFAYKEIKDISLTKDMLIVGITRKQDFLFPTADTVILPNDTLFIVGKEESMRDTHLILPIESKGIKRIVLFGATKTSFYLARLLEKKYRVIIIEADQDKSDWATQFLSNTIVYNDDIFQSNLLEEILLNEHDYFIAVSENDELNLLSSMLVKEKGLSMVACVIHRSYLLSSVEKAGIHQVFSPQIIIANDIAGIIRSRDVLTFQNFKNIEPEFVELDLRENSRLAGIALRDLTLPAQTLLVAVLRGEHVFIPRGDSVLETGDRVIALGLKENFNTLVEIFSPNEI